MIKENYADEDVAGNPDDKSVDQYNESLRTLMRISWQEHQKTREQTWKALQIEVALAAGLITVKSNFNNNKWAIIIAGLLPFLLGFFGIQITMHHRKYQQKKIKIIEDCENLLGLKKIVDEAINKIDEQSQRGNKNSSGKPVMTFALSLLIQIRLYRLGTLLIKEYYKNNIIGEVSDIKYYHIFSPFSKPSTPLFIMRMHLAIIIFSLVIIGFSII